MAASSSAEKEALLGDTSSPHRIPKEDTSAKQAANSGCFADGVTALLTMAPPPVQKAWNDNSPAVVGIWTSVRDVCKKNAQAVALVHGLFMVLYGGCWPTFALILAFLSVYDFSTLCSETMGLFNRPAASASITPAEAAKALGKVACAYVVVHALWISPFLASACVSIAIAPYAAHSVANMVLTGLFQNKHVLSRDWMTFAIEQICRVGFVVLGYFMPGMFAAIYMGLYGMTMMITQSPMIRDTLNSANNVGPVPLKIAVLWATVILATLWQKLGGYQCSMLRFIVPLGFVVASASFKISPDTWMRQFFNCHQNKAKVDPEDPPVNHTLSPSRGANAMSRSASATNSSFASPGRASQSTTSSYELGGMPIREKAGQGSKAQ